MACTDKDGGIYDRRLTIHLRIVVEPRTSLQTMILAMQEIYASANILVDIASTKHISREDLHSVEVGKCASQLTDDQMNLFATARGTTRPEDVVVYFVRETNPPMDGCAAHPDGMPGAIISSYASKWTMAHEVGHVMGLCHVNDDERLMTANGTFNITRNPPLLAASEIEALCESGLAVEC